MLIARKFYLSLIFIGFLCLKNFSQTIDFENIADYTTTTVEPFEIDNSYFQENFCIKFFEDSIGGNAPRIGKVGLPVGGGYSRDQGPLSNPECGQDTPTKIDMPNPGQNVGCYFLTTRRPDGPRPLVIDYQTRCDCSEASGVIMDIDGNEAWQIEVFDNDASNTANFTLLLSSGDPGTGDAVATPWEVGPFTYSIEKIIITYIGITAPGLAFDNFSFCSLQPETCGEVIDQDPEFTCPNTYTHTLQFQNNTEYEVTSVVLNGITPEGVTLSSQFFNFYQNPIPPGGTSEVVETEIQLDAPLEEAQEVCFDIIYLTDQEQCCHYQHCVLLEPVDPCGSLSLEATETDDNCCYEINPVNDYCADFFVGIQMDIQTEGVVFSSYNENDAWVATPNDEMTAIFWSMEQSNLPLGDLAAMPFCLGGISSANQIPQSVVVSWIALDPATGEEVAFCEETLEFFCEPCLMLDGTVECSKEDAYLYDFSITNNSDHVASMIVFEVHTPNVVFDPPFFVTTLNPTASFGELITITSVDGSPLPANTEVEFKAVLYDAEGWCCHLDDLSLLLPDCAPLTCDCPSLTDFTQQVQFLANNLGPCDEIEGVMQPLGPGGLQNMTTAGDVPAQFNF